MWCVAQERLRNTYEQKTTAKQRFRNYFKRVYLQQLILRICLHAYQFSSNRLLNIIVILSRHSAEVVPSMLETSASVARLHIFSTETRLFLTVNKLHLNESTLIHPFLPPCPAAASPICSPPCRGSSHDGGPCSQSAALSRVHSGSNTCGRNLWIWTHEDIIQDSDV